MFDILDHDGLVQMFILCTHDILLKDCLPCTAASILQESRIAPQQAKDAATHMDFPEVAPYMVALDRASQYLAQTIAYNRAHGGSTAEKRLTIARAVLATAAYRYGRALHDAFEARRYT